MHCLLLSALTLLPFPSQDAAPQVSEPIVEVALCFAAKRISSGVFLGHRTVESILAEEFALETPLDYLLTPLIEPEVDHEAGRVIVRGLGMERVAIYRPGLGCVLVNGRSEEELRDEDRGVPRSTLELAEEIPWPLGDGGVTGEPGEDVDVERLNAALGYAFEEPSGGPARRTRAVIVVHRGEIIAERYAAGFSRASRLEGWSMTKSVLSALVGIRIGQGKLALDQDHLLPEWSGTEDPRSAITVDHLLRMSSGLEWHETYADPSAGPAQMLFVAPDAAAFAARERLSDEPDTRWSYSSGTSNILSAVLRNSFEKDADYHAFPRRALFDRIGMRSAVMEADPAGNFVGSSFCFATARDWARFGLLYLGDGVFAGQRVLPEGWVDLSREPTPSSKRGRYGRHWWLNAGPPGAPDRRPFPELPADIFRAEGFEGQTVAVVPSLELVVVRLGCTKNGRGFSMNRLLTGVIAALE